MSEIQFEEEQSQGQLEEQKPFFVRMALKTGLVSTDESANKLLATLAATLILIAIALPLIFTQDKGAPTGPAAPIPTAENTL